MLAGIVIQLGKHSTQLNYRPRLLTKSIVVAVTLFTILALEFVIRYSLNRPARRLSSEQGIKYSGWSTVSRGVIWMLVGLAIATVFIFIRSVYRTIELSDGW